MHHVLNFHLTYIKWQNSKIYFLTLSLQFEKIWSIVRRESDEKLSYIQCGKMKNSLPCHAIFFPSNQFVVKFFCKIIIWRKFCESELCHTVWKNEKFTLTQGMSIQYYWYFQYFQIGIGYWYFQYFWDFSSNWSIGIEYFHFPSSNTQYFCISENLIFWFK